jgi:hypothetical protein
MNGMQVEDRGFPPLPQEQRRGKDGAPGSVFPGLKDESWGTRKDGAPGSVLPGLKVETWGTRQNEE